MFEGLEPRPKPRVRKGFNWRLFNGIVITLVTAVYIFQFLVLIMAIVRFEGVR